MPPTTRSKSINNNGQKMAIHINNNLKKPKCLTKKSFKNKFMVTDRITRSQKKTSTTNSNGNSGNVKQISNEATDIISNCKQKIIVNQCSICYQEFENYSLLMDHEKLKHKRIYCPHCKKEFARKAHLERHIRCSCHQATNSNKFKCSECEKTFSRQDNLKHHQKKHFDNDQNRERKYECQECHKMFYTPSHLLIHNRIHTGERPYQCLCCPKSFTNNGALKKHVRIHTGEKPFLCEHCGLRFSLKGTLNRHIKIHTGDKPHKCEYCGKEFIQSGGLKAHLFFHTGKNGFKCDLCDRQFNRKARLTMHKKYVHEKVKPHACSSCEKAFTRKEDLSRHLVLHTGLKNYECIYCKKCFAIKASLKVHMLTHRKEEPRSCQRCGHAFIRKDCLVRHIRKVHRDQAEPLLYQHGLMIRNDEIFTDKENSQNRKIDYQLINGKLSDDRLCEAIRDLLIFVIDNQLLKSYGWPNKPVDLLLESLIKQCNHEPARSEEFDYFGRLRENVKLLFTVVIEDESLQETLNNKTIDALIVDVIREAKIE